MTDIIVLARRHKHIASHYEGCEADHIGCLVNKLADEIERLRADLATQKGCCDGAAAQDAHVRREREEHKAEVEKLLAENERLREALVLGSEVLTSHQGSPQREWHSGGAWLYPGDSINVVRAPLPEIKVEP